MTSLATLDKANLALEKASTLTEVMKIRDVGEATKAYCRAAKIGLEMQNKCASLKLRAERKAGELLAGMPKKRNRNSSATTLGELDISHNDSSRWQRIHSIPNKAFEEHIAKMLEERKELTQSGILKLAKVHRNGERKTKASTASSSIKDTDWVEDFATLSGRRFSCFYVDPPWAYGNQSTRASTGNHYSTMTVDALSKLDIGSLSEDNAHLHLWTTNAFLFDAKQLIDAWGFEYKSCFVWVKDQMGIGNYWRVSHEFLLLGVKGKLVSKAKNLKSWAQFPRGKHSSKPDKIREFVEAMTPGPRLEMFGRRRVPGWTVFGNQNLEGLL